MPTYCADRELEEILTRTREDRKLRAQLLRMVRLSLDLRQHHFTGQIVLSFGSGVLADMEFVNRSKAEES